MNDLQNLGFTIQVVDDPTEEEIIESYSDRLFVNREKHILNENEFAKCFRDINKLQFSNGLFYTNKGKKTEDIIAQEIWLSLCNLGINTNVATTTKRLLEAIKLASTVEKLKTDENIIPFANGDLDIRTKTFYLGRYNPSPYRLKVNLPFDFPATPNYLKWLSDLLEPQDRFVLREYLGYCLVPSTKSQKALFLVGEGGAGKSVLGVILESILGEAMVSTANTQEFLVDKFKLPELENKLVLYDDDLDNAALSATGLYKKLITNTQPITADRKYGQPFKFTPQIKLVACCNEMLSSQTDQTSGFYRRLLPLKIKPVAKDFKPDLKFYDKIKEEATGIVCSALEGLLELINNDWVLRESTRTHDYLNEKQSISNPIPSFIHSVFDFDPDYEITSKELKNLRDYWCRQNDVSYEALAGLDKWLSDNGEKLGVFRDKNIRSDDKYVRGFRGMKPKPEWCQNTVKIDLKS